MPICHMPICNSPRATPGHEHAPPVGAAARLRSPIGVAQQIALSDRFLNAKNPDPTTRFPAAPKTPSLFADPMQNSVEQFQAQIHLVFGDV